MPKKLPPVHTYPNQNFCNKYLEKNKTPYRPTIKRKILQLLIKKHRVSSNMHATQTNAKHNMSATPNEHVNKDYLNTYITDQRSPVHKHLEENNYERRITMTILAQTPTEEKDTETWLKQQDYSLICKLGIELQQKHP